MIHISRIGVVMERKANGEPVPFDFKATKLNGEIVIGQNCILLSSFNRNNTVNIKYPNGQIRRLLKLGFTELNHIEVVI